MKMNRFVQKKNLIYKRPKVKNTVFEHFSLNIRQIQSFTF